MAITMLALLNDRLEKLTEQTGDCVNGSVRSKVDAGVFCMACDAQLKLSDAFNKMVVAMNTGKEVAS